MAAPTRIGESRPMGGTNVASVGVSPSIKKPQSTGRGQSTPYFSDNKRSEVNELRLAYVCQS